ncbi:hypothetical protein MRX96_047939 [Rhipicephalus microplus]
MKNPQVRSLESAIASTSALGPTTATVSTFGPDPSNDSLTMATPTEGDLVVDSADPTILDHSLNVTLLPEPDR